MLICKHWEKMYTLLVCWYWAVVLSMIETCCFYLLWQIWQEVSQSPTLPINFRAVKLNNAFDTYQIALLALLAFCVIPWQLLLKWWEKMLAACSHSLLYFRFKNFLSKGCYRIMLSPPVLSGKRGSALVVKLRNSGVWSQMAHLRRFQTKHPLPNNGDTLATGCKTYLGVFRLR